jgi:hypothetical protein
MNTSGTRDIKEQFIDLMNSDVSAIYVCGIRVLLQRDKVNVAVNTLYFKVRRAEFK